MPDRRILYLLLGVLLLIIGFLTLESCTANAEAREAHAQAAILRAENQLRGAAVEALTGERDRARATSEELTAKLDDLLRRRKPLPPAQPVPETDDELRHVLTVLGASPNLEVHRAGQTVATTQDARLFVAWGQQAARIPAFEERVGADTAALAGAKDLELSLRTEIRLCDEKGRVLGAQVSSLNQEALALRKENEGLVRVQVASSARTKIVLGVSLPLAGYLGWKLGRR